MLACTAALGAGLMAVLVLNTVISQGAFRQNELEIDLIMLAEMEERLASALQIAESPREVERAARRLGMVPAASPVFLSLSDGRVLGEPVPAEAAEGRVSFKGAPGVQRPRPAPMPTEGQAELDPAAEPTPTTDAAVGVTADPAATGQTPTPEPAAGQPPTTEPGTQP